MERVCFLLKVRPDRIDEYRRRHASVWPEMLDALRSAGWRNCARPDTGFERLEEIFHLA
jgi:L-rhamnose mutarotase